MRVLQPDQEPRCWDGFVSAYEAVFEPLTDQFARRALDALRLRRREWLLDVAAGAGGAALQAAARGARVVAVDAAPGMMRRVLARSRDAGAQVKVAVMDAEQLALADGWADAALSVFGVTLCPDPVAALAEIARVLRPGGRVAVVSWAEPERYELVSRILAAAAAVNGEPPPRPPEPLAQLRFAAEPDLRALLAAGRLEIRTVERVEVQLTVPSARWLAERLSFAPGMAALLASLASRDAVVSCFVAELEREQGPGPCALRAVALLATASAQDRATVATAAM